MELCKTLNTMAESNNHSRYLDSVAEDMDPALRAWCFSISRELQEDFMIWDNITTRSHSQAYSDKLNPSHLNQYRILLRLRLPPTEKQVNATSK